MIAVSPLCLAAKQPTRYNLLTLRRLGLSAAVLLLILSCTVANAAPPPDVVGQTVLVVPFENQSKAPGLEWIGDSFPELLQERLDSPTLYVIPREDRVRAYDRIGIPLELRASRPTIYRIAEQLDVDYVVVGEYNFDGRTFTTTAQLLDMRRQHLLPEISQSGPLPQLIDVQTELAWEILHRLFPSLTSRETYLAQAQPVRLDAFENYIKGVIAPSPEEQIEHLREAVRLNPAYSEALLKLGEIYYRQRQYDQAINSLSKIPQTDSVALEAHFYLGLAMYSRGDFSRAETAFEFVAERLPLSEIYNNLGVVADHRDRAVATEDFRKAIAEDSNDADYHFNLGVELYRSGDFAGASKQLRESVSLNPQDNEAKTLLDSIGAVSPGLRGVVTASVRIPLERIRTTYDESSFRQLALKISAAAEQKLARADAHTHAQFHVERGSQLLKQGFLDEAEREFREAIALNSSNSDAHAGLARVLEGSGRSLEARTEAEEALRLRPSAEALLLLARLDLRENRTGTAAEEIDRALRLEPANTAALALKRTVAAKLAQEAQPLPNP